MTAPDRRTLENCSPEDRARTLAVLAAWETDLLGGAFDEIDPLADDFAREVARDRRRHPDKYRR